jgi:hypothetical protein
MHLHNFSAERMSNISIIQKTCRVFVRHTPHSCLNNLLPSCMLSLPDFFAVAPLHKHTGGNKFIAIGESWLCLTTLSAGQKGSTATPSLPPLQPGVGILKADCISHTVVVKKVRQVTCNTRKSVENVTQDTAVGVEISGKKNPPRTREICKTVELAFASSPL